jgi:hypothetical protein
MTSIAYQAREAEARTLALEFARVYDTPSVRLAIQYAEFGRLEWSAITKLFAEAYGEAAAEVGI